MSYPFLRRIVGPLTRFRITSATGLDAIPRTGPVLLVANHVGFHDPLLLSTAVIMHTGGRKVHAVAKWKIFRLPLFTSWIGMIPLYADRSKTFEIAKQLLLQGEIVLMYPEGTVNMSTTIGKVKTGATRLALMTKVPVIPIGIRRTSPPPMTKIGMLFEMAYGRIRIAVGQPIHLQYWYSKPLNTDMLQEVNKVIMTPVAQLAGKRYAP